MNFEYLTRLLKRKPNIQDIFTKIYRKKNWGDFGTLSGPGSTLESTAIVRKLIPKIIEDYKIASFIDAPCGDFFWMKHIDFGSCTYLGIDVVESMIQKNNTLFATKSTTFLSADLIKDPIPYADLIFCRDCLVHLNFQDGLHVIRNFKKSGAKYLLITTFVNQNSNKETVSPLWRPLNLQKDPFNFPKPIALFDEQSKHDPAYPDKALGLWDLQSINI